MAWSQRRISGLISGLPRSACSTSGGGIGSEPSKLGMFGDGRGAGVDGCCCCNECMGNSIRSRASGGEAAADRDFAALRRDTRSQPAKQQKASTRKSPTPSTAPNSAVFSSASVKDWRCGGSGEGGGEGGGGGKDGSR